MLHKLTTLSKQSAIYGIGTFLNRGIGFLLVPLYTRFLTTEDYGINGSVGAFVGVLNIVLTLSLQSAIARFYYDFEDEKEQRTYFGSVWILMHVLGLALVLILDVTGNWLFSVTFRDVSFYPCGRLALWSTFFTIASILPTTIFRVRERPQIFIGFSISQFLLRVLLNIFFVVHLREGVVGIFKSALLANLAYAVPYTWVSFSNIEFALKLDQLYSSLKYSLPFVPHRLSNWVLNVSDRILLENFVSLGDLGLYSLGYRFGQILASILDAVNLAWAPFYFKTAKEPGGKQALSRLITYYMFALMFIVLGNVLLSREVIFLMAAPRFHPAYQIVPLISFSYGLHGIYLVMFSSLSYTKKTARLPTYTAISAAVNVGINVFFIPRYGIFASAWATLIAFLVRTVLVSIEAIRVFPIQYDYKRLGWGIGIALLLFTGWFIDVGDWWANLAIKIALICAYPIIIRYSGLLYPNEIAGLLVLQRKLYAKLILPR